MLKVKNRAAVFILIAASLPLIFQADTVGQRRRPADVNQKNGLQFRLSEGKDESKPRTAPPLPAPPAEPISDEAAQNLLKRLPPIKSEADDEKDFALRDRSLPAPRTGQTISESFPPSGTAGSPDQVASGPLEVARLMPEGEVPIAPHLSVTFTQPMVAVTSNDDLAAAEVPVKLSPRPQGKWRWIGTKTLLFEPTGRFPMATSYAVEIPAGTKSAAGNALSAAKRWTFTTPPLQIKSKHPTAGPHSRNPVFFIEFDQRINADALLGRINVEAANRKVSLRLATAEEIESDETARRMKSEAIAGNWIAFRASAPLTAGTNYTVTIERGAPSAEGLRTTTTPQTFAFHTYHPLQLVRHECGYQRQCEPGWPWSLAFNNPLDVSAFDKRQVRVEPDVTGMKVNNFGYAIQIEGATKGRTTYKVTLDAAIKDVYGQTLAEPKTVTFNVGDASPNLAAAAEGFTVLDPYAAPRFSVFTTNHQQLKVSLHAVGPEQWAQFAAFMRREQQGERRIAMPPIGRVVSSKVINIAGKPDDLAETPIDLKPALPLLMDGLGHVIVSVEAVQPPRTDYERRSLQVWVQATNIGLDAFADQTNLLGWATSLRDGKPIGDVRMSVVMEKLAATARADAGARTGGDGLAKLALPAAGGRKLLIARKGKDVAILPESQGWWDDENYSQWRKRESNDALRWHVFDDRGLYRPGEEVRIKGWLRRIAFGPAGDVGAAGGVTAVSYTLRDSRGNEILKGSGRVNALGGFDAAFKLPPTMNLGRGHLQLQAEGALANIGEESRLHHHSVNVQEFRRPEYEVKATTSEGPHFVGTHATITVAASYYAGGGLANAEVNWNVTATPTNFTPPNRGDFSFGKWTPWWEMRQSAEGGNNQQYQARTDATGKHHLRIDLDSVNPPRPTSITAYANVQDVNRQNVSGQTAMLVHPSALYVGLRSPRMFVQKGEPLVVEAIVTDLDGKAIVNREIRMRAALLDWTFTNGEWREAETNVQDCVIKSANDAVKCTFQTSEGGRYRITASVLDERERRNESELTLWVAGGKQPPQRDLAQEKVELIPGQKEYQPGQTAEILIQAPFAPAEGVMTLRRDGLLTTERFTIASPSHTLKIPIQDAYTPNVHVQVDLAGASTRNDEARKPQANLPKRPAFASGTINLSIPPVRRKLAVTATPRDKAIEPGMETTVDVELRDATGKTVGGGEVAIVVVDESVLALSNYRMADPLNNFYSQRGDNVSNHHLREKVQLGKAADLISQMRRNAGGRQSG